MTNPQLNELKKQFSIIEAVLATPAASSRLKGCLERVHQALDHLEMAFNQEESSRHLESCESFLLGALERLLDVSKISQNPHIEDCRQHLNQAISSLEIATLLEAK